MQNVDMNKLRKKLGFTLIEVMLATSLSIMVFFAMGVLLTKSFALWKDATAHWRMAQTSRISRERILCGITNYVFNGVTNLTGLLSATNVVITSDAGWQTITYSGSGGNDFMVRGWSGEAGDKDIQLRKDGSGWEYGQTFGTAVPSVKVDFFSASVTNDVVTVSYRLRFSAAGKVFTQPHTINIALLNKE
jgi:hypothetical protein